MSHKHHRNVRWTTRTVYFYSAQKQLRFAALWSSFAPPFSAEEVDCNEYATLAQAQAEIGGFIERIYNRKRLHSSLGYVPAAEFEEAFAAIEGAKTAA